MAASKNSNTPQPPLVRGEDASLGSVYGNKQIEDTPSPPLISSPLIRGVWGGCSGREGFAFLPYDKKLTALARENRKNPTNAEQKIWLEVLSRRQFAAYKFLRQKPVEHFIVDFYCAKLGWVIEIDGDSHAEQKGYDENRSVFLQGHGLTVIRYENRDVLNNIAGVYDDLARRLS